MEKFYLLYCDDDARDVLIEYLRNFHRPTKVPPRNHSDCIEAMIKYTNKLPGLEPKITPAQAK
eukprot:10131904-Ditylum_brightwellii.AAC.1